MSGVPLPPDTNRNDRPVHLAPVPDWSQRPGQIPSPVTPLIGREHEITVVSERLRGGAVRLVVLTGPGGVGKTRLSLQLAHDLRDTFADGVWFVRMAAVTQPDRVIPTIARALGVWEGSQRPVGERLQALLEHQHALLVIDNIEQVVEAASQLAALLRACPRLSMLITSRSVLHLTGEHDVAISPLSLPGNDGDALVENVTMSEAGRLFVERAQAVRSDFALTPANAADVAAICRRVDGLPLAVELAAARIAHLPPQAILARLNQRLPLLTGGARDLPARLQTMRNAIAWSHDLLTPDERTMFRRLAVFVDGFSLDAVEAVASDLPDAFDVLASLMDQSLVKQVAMPDDTPRFLMLQTIREFGLEHLAASGENDEVRHRHAAWCLAMAKEIGAGFEGPTISAWGDRLEMEHGNVRAALDWLVAKEDIAGLLELSNALDPMWWYLGHSREGLRWLLWALERSDDVPAPLVISSILAAARLVSERGDFAEAAELLEDGVDRARAIGDQPALAGALTLLGQNAQLARDVETGRERLQQALIVYQAVGDQAGAAMSRTLLAMMGDLGGIDQPGNAQALATARACWEEELRLFQERGNIIKVARALHGLAYVAYRARDFPRALDLSHQSIRLRWAKRHIRPLPANLEDVADIARINGQPETAARLYGAAEVLREIIDAPIPPWFRPEYDREIDEMRRAMPADRFAAAWAAGRALELEQAVVEALAVTVSSQPVAQPPSHGLTPREVEVLRLLVEGHSNPGIADALFISPKTAANHVASILAKFGVESRTAAVSHALRHHLI